MVSHCVVELGSAILWKSPVLVLSGVVVGCAIYLVWSRRATPSPLSHLKLGRKWEYEVSPGGAVETATVLESSLLDDGRRAYRVEFRRGEIAIDGMFTNDRRGQLIQLSQSAGSTTFHPPVIGLGRLRVGSSWSSSCQRIYPSMFSAATATEVSGQVVAHESVTVPAGTFQAFRIEGITNGQQCTTWYSPNIGPVREISNGEEMVLRRLIEPDPQG